MGGLGAVPRIERARLLDPARDATVVVLEGPGGSGKSALADQVVELWEQRALRVRFTDHTDLAGAVAALRRSLRRSGLGGLVDALDRADGPADSLDALAGAMATGDDRITLVLDDVHWLDPDAAAALAEAFDDLPRTARIVVAGRSLGPFARWRGRAGARSFGTDDLRMDHREVAEVLRVDGGSLAEEVHAATGGWCAAVALAAARLATDPTWSPVGPGGARALLRSLVADEVGRDPRLALLAQVPLVDDDVCQLLGGLRLAAAVRSGLVTVAPGPWSSVPDLVAEVIADVAAEANGHRVSLDDDVAIEVAQHYREAGEPAAAVALAESTPAASQARFLGTWHWTELEELGPRTLRRLIDAIDDEDLAARSALLLAAARAAERSDPAWRQACLDRAEAVAARNEGAAAARAIASERMRDAVAAHELDGVVDAVTALLAEAGPDEGITRARALMARARSEVFACTPDSMARGADDYAAAAELLEAAGETRWLVEALARRGYTALFLAGRPAEGAEEMGRALARLPVGDATRASWLAHLADVLDVLGRATEADAALVEAREIGARRHDASLTGLAWWTETWLAARRRQPDRLARAVEALEADLDRWAPIGQLVEVAASTAECFARIGDERGSARYCRLAAELAAPIGYDAPVQLAQSRHDALFGDARSAQVVLGGLEATSGIVPFSRPTRLAVLALAHARAGDAAAADRSLVDARASAVAMGIPDLLERLEAEVLERLADATAGAISGPHRPTDPAPVPRIELQLLGGFAVHDGGGDRTPHPGHPSTLVKLLALGGPMTSDAAIDALWPEVDVVTGRARLRNLLNRLKERSGALVVRAGGSLALADGVVSDVELFESGAAAALAGVASERVGLARSAMALYRGELLPEDRYEDWAAAPRERLKRRHLSLLDVVASDLIERGDHAEAARLLEDGIVIEPLDQGRYQQLCAVLLADGRVGSARTVAARARAALEEIGLELPPDLAALVDPS